MWHNSGHGAAENDTRPDEPSAAEVRFREAIKLLHHELRAPIAPLYYRIEYFRTLLEQRGILDQEARLALSDMQDEVQHLHYLMSGANVLSSDDLALTRYYGNLLADVVRPVAALFSGVAAGRGVTIRMSVLDALPDMTFDRGLARQLLYALLSNAVKYADKGTDVVLLAETTHCGGVLRIQNQGLEIPAGWESAIFEVGIQAPNACRQHTPGAGLGLAVAKRIAEAHGWRLTLVSRRAPTEFAIQFAA